MNTRTLRVLDADTSINLETRRRIAAEHVEVIRWNGHVAECLCPEGHAAQLFIDDRPLPTLHCHHERCQDAVAEINRELRRTMCNGPRYRHKLSEEQRRKKAQNKRLLLLEAQARHRLLPKLLEQPPVPLREWLAQSPVKIPDDPREHWRMFLRGMYEPDDIVWTGFLYDSGRPEHRSNFKPVSNWLQCRITLGPQVSQCCFKPGSFGRTKENGTRRRYLVLESDIIGREQFGNVIRWLTERGRTLRAIVDTGGKSLHAWFDRPPFRGIYDMPAQIELNRLRHSRSEALNSPRTEEESRNFYAHYARLTHLQLRSELELEQHCFKEAESLAVLKGLGCDSKLWHFNSTARLPGWPRLDEDETPTGRYQRLIYFNPNYTEDK